MQDPARRLRPRTIAADRTASTDLWGKDDFHALSCPTPPRTGVTLRAGGLLVVPIELKMRQIEALACFGLPAIVRKHRTTEPDPMLLLTGHDEFSIDVAAIDDLLLGQEMMSTQVLLNSGRHFHILQWGHGCLHLHNGLLLESERSIRPLQGLQ